MFYPPTLAVRKAPEGQYGRIIFGALVAPWLCGNAGRAAPGSRPPAHPLSPSTLSFLLHREGRGWHPQPARPVCVRTAANTHPFAPLLGWVCVVSPRMDESPRTLHSWPRTRTQGHLGTTSPGPQDLQHGPEGGRFSFIPQTPCPTGRGTARTAPRLPQCEEGHGLTKEQVSSTGKYRTRGSRDFLCLQSRTLSLTVLLCKMMALD